MNKDSQIFIRFLSFLSTLKNKKIEEDVELYFSSLLPAFSLLLFLSPKPKELSLVNPQNSPCYFKSFISITVLNRSTEVC